MPMRLYHCNDDQVVLVENSLFAYDNFVVNNAQNVELMIQEGGSHDACLLPFYIDAINWFDSLR